MKIPQLSLFIENKPGHMIVPCRQLADAGINVVTLSLADTGQFGILRLIVDDVERAKSILKREGLTVGETDVVAVEVPDRPGGLAHLLQVFKDENVNVEYMYAFVKAPSQSAVMIFRFDDPHRALQALQDKGIRTIPGAELYSM